MTMCMHFWQIALKEILYPAVDSSLEGFPKPCAAIFEPSQNHFVRTLLRTLVPAAYSTF